jgi:hypothetical protein
MFGENGASGSNPAWTTLQSLRFDTFGESFKKTRIDAGFEIRVDPENGLIVRFSSEIPKTYPATIFVVPT